MHVNNTKLKLIISKEKNASDKIVRFSQIASNICGERNSNRMNDCSIATYRRPSFHKMQTWILWKHTSRHFTGLLDRMSWHVTDPYIVRPYICRSSNFRLALNPVVKRILAHRCCSKLPVPYSPFLLYSKREKTRLCQFYKMRPAFFK